MVPAAEEVELCRVKYDIHPDVTLLHVSELNKWGETVIPLVCDGGD